MRPPQAAFPGGGGNAAFTRPKVDGTAYGRRRRIRMARILLAEDDDSLRAFLASNLGRAGHEVAAYADGESAWDALELADFDLLLTDIVMPGMDGIELARRAAELRPSLKIVFITGFAAVALTAQSRAPKDAKVLSKPFHLKDLVTEVERVIAA
jgi:two-component system cell cycle response regulator CpdR